MYKGDTLIEVMRAKRRGDLCLLCFETLVAKEEICLVSSVKNEEAWLLHTIFCHLNFHTLHKLVKLKLVKGLPEIKFEKDHLCSACEMGKLKRSSHKTKSNPSYDKPLQMLHVNLYGPIAVQSLGGKKYILVLIDNDNGIEFKNSTTEDYLTSVGITHNFSAPRTPQQNEVVERKNSTLVEAARTMLNASGLPLIFWAEAVSTACYTQNRSLVVKRHEKTPYQLLYNKRPNIKIFHVFVCNCYVFNDREPIGKFDPKGDDTIFIGYASDSVAYRVYVPRTKIVVVSTNVKFDDSFQVTQDKFKEELKIQAEASLNATIIEDPERLLSDWYEDFEDSNRASINADKSSTNADRASKNANRASTDLSKSSASFSLSGPSQTTSISDIPSLVTTLSPTEPPEPSTPTDSTSAPSIIPSAPSEPITDAKPIPQINEPESSQSQAQNLQEVNSSFKLLHAVKW
ncbi:hypothetical protein OSB04_024818 [Centaurea solstitialis]|uniref:Integrase catalytic domain-containing protein n=1 Tax=Centaurea solstitialis TaxID=347529 RepID=A0AA38SYJ3_9ASTR|nr:hypothetical protein OSB04_024818 [Centaurea solstitialis]